MRVSRIPVAQEMPLAYRRVYWANWWAKLTKRDAPNPDATGECIGCEVKGILGYELIHRGISRPTNLMCDACNVAGGKGYEVVGLHKEVGGTVRNRPRKRSTVVRKRRVQRG